MGWLKGSWATGVLIGIVLATSLSFATELSSKTLAAYEAYVAGVDSSIRKQHASADSFLQFAPSSRRTRSVAESRLRNGDLLIEKVEADSVPDGLIHHWRGAGFLPGASLASTLVTVQDYDSFAQLYSPEVMRSSRLSRHGDSYEFAMRLRKHKVITVVLDTVSTVRFGQLDPEHRFSTLHMTRISEVADPGKPAEHLLPPGHDNGFMWRMDTYWSYVQVPGGVIVECETISLSRDVPFGLKLVVGPFIESIPRESLEFTLNATREAVAHRAVAKK